MLGSTRLGGLVPAGQRRSAVGYGDAQPASVPAALQPESSALQRGTTRQGQATLGDGLDAC